jgi:hypothetical protein
MRNMLEGAADPPQLFQLLNLNMPPGLYTAKRGVLPGRKQIYGLLQGLFLRLINKLPTTERDWYFPNGGNTSQSIVFSFFQYNKHGYICDDVTGLNLTQNRNLLRATIQKAKTRVQASSGRRCRESTYYVITSDVESALQELLATVASVQTNQQVTDDKSISTGGDHNPTITTADGTSATSKKIPGHKQYVDTTQQIVEEINQRISKRFKFFDLAIENIERDDSVWVGVDDAVLDAYELCSEKEHLKGKILGRILNIRNFILG